MVTLCNWTARLDGTFVCEACGEVRASEVTRNCGAASVTSTASPPPGLGDYTEQLLSSIGYTKEVHLAIKQEFGLAPTCDCDARKEYLNRVGEKFGEAINKVGAWIGL